MQLHDLGLIGNSTTSALIDGNAKIAWWCFPFFDSPSICNALATPCGVTNKDGFIDVLFEKIRSKDQYYIRNTPVLVTRLADNSHNVIETVDFAPCYIQFGRLYTPPTICRIIRRVAGRPRIAIRACPANPAGGQASQNIGANHVTFNGNGQGMRITTDAPLPALIDGQAFFLEDSITLVMGTDEPLLEAPKGYGRHAYEATVAYWHNWIHNIEIPLEWQDEVIRAAITLRLNTFYGTGAIVAGHTILGSGCQEPSRATASLSWVHEAATVTRALNRLGATGTMERYLDYLNNVIADANGLPFQAVYDIHRRTVIARDGNGIWETSEHHDSYGAAVLACMQAFFDHRLYHPAGKAQFQYLENLGEIAFEKYRQPDLDVWGQGESAVHTYSSIMCWVACERLSRIAEMLDMEQAAKEWAERAATIHERILENAWNDALGTFTSTWHGDTVDATLLRIPVLKFLPADDPRTVRTINYVTDKLKRGDFVSCTENTDKQPSNMPLTATFWWIQAQHALGRTDIARDVFERILGYRNHLGLLSSCLALDDRSFTGAFPSTSAMVGIIQCAVELSKPWDSL